MSSTLPLIYITSEDMSKLSSLTNTGTFLNFTPLSKIMSKFTPPAMLAVTFPTSDVEIVDVNYFGINYSVPLQNNTINLTVNCEKYGIKRFFKQLNYNGYIANMGYSYYGFEPWEYALLIMKCYMHYYGFYNEYISIFFGTNDPTVSLTTNANYKMSYPEIYNAMRWMFGNTSDLTNYFGYAYPIDVIKLNSYIDYILVYTLVSCFVFV